MTWREIITNAAADAKLCSIRQQLSASLLQTGKLSLKERISQYSNSDFLEFARKSIEFEYKPNSNILTKGNAGMIFGWYTLKPEYTEGQNFFTVYNDTDLPAANESLRHAKAYNPDKPLTAIECIAVGPGTYSWRYTNYQNINTLIGNMDCFETYPDILVKNMETVTRCYCKMQREYTAVKFVSYEDYDLFNTGSAVYTTIQRSNTDTEFLTKYTQPKYKLVYNEKFEMDDLDKQLTIPDKWQTLFTTALTVDYARKYPRLSDSTYNTLKDRLNEMEHNIKRSSSVNKFVGRYNYGRTMTYNDGLNGTFLI